MARIHGISGSTRYLMNGTRPINGKRLSTLEEIDHFYSNFDQILTEIEVQAALRQDQLLAETKKTESRLDREIKDGILQRTIEVNRDILAINDEIEASPNIFRRSWYVVQFWGACALSSYRIQQPFLEKRNQLDQIRYHLNHYSAADREDAIRRERQNVLDNHAFLKQHETSLIGARGEEDVISVLSGLPDEYHILNDVNIHFRKYIPWTKYREYIKTSQIDHVVIGPSGLYLLETKNWKRSNIRNKSDDLSYQVNRANYALWHHLKDHYWKNEMPSIRNVIVSMHGIPYGQKTDPYIAILSPDRLCNYITKPDTRLSEADIHKLIRLIPCREVD
jgi:hypothetical protein